MNATPYSIDFEVPTRLLYVRLSGYWTEQQAEDFTSLIRDHQRHLGKDVRGVLLDVRDFEVQSQQVVPIIHRLYQENPQMRAALITCQSAIFRMQARRVAPEQSTMGLFDTEQSARDWLTSNTVSDS